MNIETNIENLARPEIRNLRPYVTARQVEGTLRLNANEAPWEAEGEGLAGLNRYPEIRPSSLHRRLADQYGVAHDMLLATRGSSEAIDLLIRAFCRAGQDNIMTCPPTFAMYRVYADIQGTATLSTPLLANHDFAMDTDAVIRKCGPGTKLIFVCSPNNPTGTLVPLASVQRLAEARHGQSLVVVDEAYAEFSEAHSASALLKSHENVVVLRTLSKAHSLAGARCGAVLAAPALIRLLDGILAPYAISSPVVEYVLRALQAPNLERTKAAVRRILTERERVSRALQNCPDVVRVWPSSANFLLVEFADLEVVDRVLSSRQILVRSFGKDEMLRNCARITVGTPRENDRLIAALRCVRESA